MVLVWLSTKIVQNILIRQKTWPPEGVVIFPYMYIVVTLKILLCETAGPILSFFYTSGPCVTLYQDCSDYKSYTWVRLVPPKCHLTY